MLVNNKMIEGVLPDAAYKLSGFTKQEFNIISKELEKLIDNYPITPYLDNRDSFVRWTHFIHNKINEKLELQNTDQETYVKQ